MSSIHRATSNHYQVMLNFCNLCYGHYSRAFFISDVKVTLRQDFMDVLRVGIRQGEETSFLIE